MDGAAGRSQCMVSGSAGPEAGDEVGKLSWIYDGKYHGYILYGRYI